MTEPPDDVTALSALAALVLDPGAQQIAQLVHDTCQAADKDGHALLLIVNTGPGDYAGRLLDPDLIEIEIHYLATDPEL